MIHRLAIPCVLLAIAATTASTATVAIGQAPILVRDLATGTPQPGSNPWDVVGLTSGDVLFTANISNHRRALFRSAAGVGTPQPWQDFDQPANLAAMGSWAIFNSANAVWATDGTAAGTRFLIGEEGVSASMRFVPFGTRALFLSGNVYVSDGTTNGTVRLTAFSSTRYARALPVVAGTQAFFGILDNNQPQLWKTDGTLAGTSKIVDLPSRGLAALGARVVVEVIDSSGDKSFWISDGTAAGTRLLADIDGARRDTSARSSAFGLRSNTLVFGTQSASGGEELWQTDGTTAGTTRLAPLPGRVTETATAGAVLFFVCETGATSELWRTDGTQAGTSLLRRFAYVVDMEGDGTRLLFSAAATGTPDLWISDGTVVGTVVLRTGGNPGALTRVRTGRVLCRLESGNIGYELWETDGTPAGTKLFADIPTRERTLSSFFVASVQSSGLAMYAVSRGQPGGHVSVPAQLVISDGTTTGTHATGVEVREGDPLEVARIGRDVLFRAEEAGTGFELYRTDGTPAGTGLLADIHPNQQYINGSYPGHFVQLGGAIYFTARGQNQGQELWRTDGTAASTRLVRDLYPGTGSGVKSSLLRWRDRLYFLGSSGGRQEIYSTDGSTGFTALDSTQSSTPWTVHLDPGLAGTTERLFFWAAGAGSGTELWSTDGTVPGTSLVRDIAPGIADGFAYGPREVIGRWLYFVAQTPATGPELWRSDGTTAGTVLLRDIRPGPEGSAIRQMTAVGSTLFFVADDGTSGAELWRSDGTSAGTSIVRDLYPGRVGGLQWSGGWSPVTMIGVGGRLYFAATDGLSGTELWSSDGTAAGTQLVVDLHPGVFGSYPSGLHVVRGDLLFHADDGVLGTELWRLPLAATAEILGAGCGAGAPPTLSATPPRLGGPMTLAVKAPLGNSGMLLLGTGFTYPTHIGSGCSVFVDLAQPFVTVPFVLTPQGSWQAQFTVPNIPTLANALLPAQAGVGPTARAPLGLDLTNAVLLAPR